MAARKLERELREFSFTLAPNYARPECRKNSKCGNTCYAGHANQMIETALIFRTLEPLDWSPLLFVWITALHRWGVLSIILRYHRISFSPILKWARKEFSCGLNKLKITRAINCKYAMHICTTWGWTYCLVRGNNTTMPMAWSTSFPAWGKKERQQERLWGQGCRKIPGW